MPWKETSPMDQRLAFVVEWLKHETSMAVLCRSFGISRQTGYVLVAQFQAEGLDGLKPRSCAPRPRIRAGDPNRSSRLPMSPRRSPVTGRWPARAAPSWHVLGW